MRYVRYICIALFAIALVSVALANRQFVTLNVIPDELANQFQTQPTIDLPLFIVIFGAIITGLLIGFFWEWMREHAVRSEANRKAREVRKLEREVKALKAEARGHEDDVLAILETAPKPQT